jgi:hypothetical protein
MWLIYQQKASRPARAAQQLSDCLRAGLRVGQFVSDAREANLIRASRSDFNASA